MTKKTRKTKNNKQAEDALDELKVELTEAAAVENEASASVASTDSTADVSLDDLLDDVRRSLIEEDADDEKKTHWWNKSSKGKHIEQSDATETSSYVIEKPKEEDPYLEQIDELIDLLEPEAGPIQVEAVAEPEITPPVEPEVVPDVDDFNFQLVAGRFQSIRHVHAPQRSPDGRQCLAIHPHYREIAHLA